MTDIHLYMEGLNDNKSIPLRLEINGIIYEYGEDKLFQKLVDHKGERILVSYSGLRASSKEYIINEIDLGDIPKLDLIDIEEKE